MKQVRVLWCHKNGSRKGAQREKFSTWSQLCVVNANDALGLSSRNINPLWLWKWEWWRTHTGISSADAAGVGGVGFAMSPKASKTLSRSIAVSPRLLWLQFTGSASVKSSQVKSQVKSRHMLSAYIVLPTLLRQVSRRLSMTNCLHVYPTLQRGIHSTFWVTSMPSLITVVHLSPFTNCPMRMVSYSVNSWMTLDCFQYYAVSESQGASGSLIVDQMDTSPE